MEMRSKSSRRKSANPRRIAITHYSHTLHYAAAEQQQQLSSREPSSSPELPQQHQQQLLADDKQQHQRDKEALPPPPQQFSLGSTFAAPSAIPAPMLTAPPLTTSASASSVLQALLRLPSTLAAIPDESLAPLHYRYNLPNGQVILQQQPPPPSSTLFEGPKATIFPPMMAVNQREAIAAAAGAMPPASAALLAASMYAAAAAKLKEMVVDDKGKMGIGCGVGGGLASCCSSPSLCREFKNEQKIEHIARGDGGGVVHTFEALDDKECHPCHGCQDGSDDCSDHATMMMADTALDLSVKKGCSQGTNKNNGNYGVAVDVTAAEEVVPKENNNHNSSSTTTAPNSLFDYRLPKKVEVLVGSESSKIHSEYGVHGGGEVEAENGSKGQDEEGSMPLQATHRTNVGVGVPGQVVIEQSIPNAEGVEGKNRTGAGGENEGELQHCTQQAAMDSSDSMGYMDDSYLMNSISKNKLGRAYNPGRPLAMEEREKILRLYQKGLKISHIAKLIGVTHSCVSKIMSRYRRTGSMNPRSAQASRLHLSNHSPPSLPPTFATATAASQLLQDPTHQLHHHHQHPTNHNSNKTPSNSIAAATLGGMGPRGSPYPPPYFPSSLVGGGIGGAAASATPPSSSVSDAPQLAISQLSSAAIVGGGVFSTHTAPPSSSSSALPSSTSEEKELMLLRRMVAMSTAASQQQLEQQQSQSDDGSASTVGNASPACNGSAGVEGVEKTTTTMAAPLVPSNPTLHQSLSHPHPPPPHFFHPLSISPTQLQQQQQQLRKSSLGSNSSRASTRTDETSSSVGGGGGYSHCFGGGGGVPNGIATTLHPAATANIPMESCVAGGGGSLPPLLQLMGSAAANFPNLFSFAPFFPISSSGAGEAAREGILGGSSDDGGRGNESGAAGLVEGDGGRRRPYEGDHHDQHHHHHQQQQLLLQTLINGMGSALIGTPSSTAASSSVARLNSTRRHHNASGGGGVDSSGDVEPPIINGCKISNNKNNNSSGAGSNSSVSGVVVGGGGVGGFSTGEHGFHQWMKRGKHIHHHHHPPRQEEEEVNGGGVVEKGVESARGD